MKFLAAILAYLLIGLMLVSGILHAVRGSYWLLVTGVLVYAVLLGRIGCMPKDSHSA